MHFLIRRPQLDARLKRLLQHRFLDQRPDEPRETPRRHSKPSNDRSIAIARWLKIGPGSWFPRRLRRPAGMRASIASKSLARSGSVRIGHHSAANFADPRACSCGRTPRAGDARNHRTRDYPSPFPPWPCRTLRILTDDSYLAPLGFHGERAMPYHQARPPASQASRAVPPPRRCLYSEELFGTEGFVGPTSTMYHIHPPTQVYGWKPQYSTKVEYVDTRHHADASPQVGADEAARATSSPGAWCCSATRTVEMAVINPAEQMAYHFKNGQGDECLFIHFGSGVCHTMLGTLKFGPKDYLVIPKGVIYKLIWDKRENGPDGKPKDNGPPIADYPFGKVLLIETCNGSHIGPPPRYVSKTTSQYLEHAPDVRARPEAPRVPAHVGREGRL